MAEKYSLDDEGKALRIVLDFVQEEADLDTCIRASPLQPLRLTLR